MRCTGNTPASCLDLGPVPQRSHCVRAGSPNPDVRLVPSTSDKVYSTCIAKKLNPERVLDP